MNKSISIVALAMLAACGGGGSSGGGGITPPVQPIVTPAQFPTPSGHPVAFIGRGGASVASVATIRAALITTADVTPTPTPTPIPTPVPLPSPSGNPLIPTRVSVGIGSNSSIGSYLDMMVLDGSSNPVVETNSPAILSSRPDILTLITPLTRTDATYPDAWVGYFQFNGTTHTPQTVQVAASFPDAVGVINVNQYDAFTLSCVDGDAGMSVTTGQGLRNNVSPDIGMTNCNLDSQPNLVLPRGFMIAAPRQADAFGQYLPAFNDLLSARPFVSQGTTIYGSQLPDVVGCILQGPDSNGLQHKYMVNGINLNGSKIDGVTVLQLSADRNGVFAF